MPICAVIDQVMFCVHGGLSPQLESLDNIRQIERPVDIPEYGLLCDLVWSDPRDGVEEWEPNRRGASVYFGRSHVERFIEACDLDIICRAHETVAEGYEFPFYPEQTLLTIFSAPNYMYTQRNRAAILHVTYRVSDDESIDPNNPQRPELDCKFTVMGPAEPENETSTTTGAPE
jgi:serine/threonine-protein phosphatase PP1 catalytic subunit